jgi:hypothetical protein
MIEDESPGELSVWDHFPKDPYWSEQETSLATVRPDAQAVSPIHQH